MKMLVNHRYAVMIVVAILVLASLTVFLSTASAQEPPSDETSYTSTSQDRSDNFLLRWFNRWFATGIKFSPSGCVQLANDPRTVAYRSITSEVRAVCRNSVPEMYHTANLRKRVDDGLSGWRYAASGQFFSRSVRLGSAFANTNCENMIYMVAGQGWVVDVDNKLYYASNNSREVINPCNYP